MPQGTVIYVNGKTSWGKRPGGLSAAIFIDGRKVAHLLQKTHDCTRIEAVYGAARLGLDRAYHISGIKSATIVSDCIPFINQMKGGWCVWRPHIRVAYDALCDLARHFDKVAYCYADKTHLEETALLASLARELPTESIQFVDKR